MASHSEAWKKARLRPALNFLHPYVAGKGFGEISRRYGFDAADIVKLGSNENPYGPSPRAREALASAAMERYPEPEELLAGLSAYTGFPQDMILLGAGMDGVMDTLSRIFLEPGDTTFIPTPTFSYYEILTIMAGARPIFSARGPRHELAEAVPEKAKMAFLCSPNNPTGNVLSEKELRAILESTDAIVFLDEAYVEFARESLILLVSEYDNLIVGRTLSKAFGLAGMRLGYALAPEWIAEQYRRAAPPFYGISSASAATGAAALSDLPFMRRSVERIVSERERLVREIGCDASQANFLYLRTELPSDQFAERFLCQGIIIRDCRSFRGAGEHQVRVTVGRPEENQRFLSAYQEICR
ncbi:MAG: putative aspartate aminotransferase 2 [Euryarchaeota archaeon ADurb.Bin190]|nr:MAG: putative aspartate aminotransferase 2 [Euryarchaeota archaeon ADurb.Bin190]HNU39635.1 histidinol-phosphate transaminase [Methanothrix sp.]